VSVQQGNMPEEQLFTAWNIYDMILY